MQNFLLENHRESNCRSKCGKVRKFSVFLLDVPSELQFQAKKYPGALAAQLFYGQAIARVLILFCLIIDCGGVGKKLSILDSEIAQSHCTQDCQQVVLILVTRL